MNRPTAGCRYYKLITKYKMTTHPDVTTTHFAVATALATNGNIHTIPLVYGGGVMLDDDAYKGKMIYVSGKDVFMPDVIVKTSMDAFVKTVNSMSKKRATQVFPQVWANIKKVNVDKVYEEQGSAWKDLLDDIMIYYACRFKLFNTPAPLLDFTEEDDPQ